MAVAIAHFVGDNNILGFAQLRFAQLSFAQYWVINNTDNITDN
jgi:hypothetical protein